jgi:hypothetical protein
VRRVVLLFVLLVVLAVAWVGVRGYLAKGHLDDAADRLPAFEQQMGDLEVEAARTTLGQVQGDTSAARDLTGDPVWQLLGAFPWGGQNLEAVRTATVTVDDVVTEGLPGLVDAGEGVVAFRDSLGEGDLDGSGLDEAADGVDRLDASLTQARQDLAAIDRRYLVDQVEAAVTELEDSLDVARQVGSRVGEQLTPEP